MTAVVRVEVDKPYDVVVGQGPGMAAEVGRRVPGAGRVAIVVADEPALAPLAAAAGAALRAAGRDVAAVTVDAGEGAKTARGLERLWTALAAARVGRDGALVAVGGGATTDLVGFAAATWLRGIPVVHVPTTLLAMVDAAVGGKTGIDLPAGKNLVGAFHQPSAVVCDLGALATLPAADLRAGLAEVVKAGFLADERILTAVERDPAGAVVPGPLLADLVVRAVRVKAAVVAADPHERDLRGVGRAALNYGHTLGHAVEAVERYRWRHGDAVSVGLVYAAELARLAGRLDETTAARHRSVLEALGLPTTYAGGWAPLRAAMEADKKASVGRLRFVVLDGPGEPGWLVDPEEALLEKAFAAVRR